MAGAAPRASAASGSELGERVAAVAPERGTAHSTSSGEAVIEYDAVTKRFFSRGSLVTAIQNVNLAVRRKAFTSVVGPSGCGKTTLLRLAAGLELPSAGETRYDGRRVTAINTEVGYVTQDSNLYPWMNLRQNVEFPLEIKGLAPRERHARADEYIAMVGLEGFESHYPYQLSGGMQKRGSIIRTMIYDPSVILMDEPFGPLDAQTRMVLQADLLRISAQRAQTILFITHDLTEAIALSDTVVVMSARPGKIKQVFDIPLARPRDVFQIHEQPGFAETYAEIWDCFRSEVLSQREMRPADVPDEPEEELA
jgi:NitT/TauT family transport system ATP-binding protein